MILIDALYINRSGGLRLLEYLVFEMEKRDVPFHLLADYRCRGVFKHVKSVEYLKASMVKRYVWYSSVCHYSSVLCFGNIPPPKRFDGAAYTYFHNINLLTIAEAKTWKEWVMSWLKREVFRLYKNNTDFWLTQTSNTADELVRHLHESIGRVMTLPFYDIPDSLRLLNGSQHGRDYAFISDYTGAKGHEELLNAWILLHEKGINRTLHLTVHERNVAFLNKVQQARDNGVDVINHGFIPFERVVDLYRQSAVVIYPSHNESLGLGLVEGLEAGCDIIASDLPFVHAICKPSAVFDPLSPKSIVDAVIAYENGNGGSSELLINNQIETLIDLLNK